MKKKSILTEHSECKKCRTGVICPVLEKDLSRFNSNRQSISAKRYSNISEIANLVDEKPVDNETLLREIKAKLKRYALPAIYVEVVAYISLHGKINGIYAYAAKDLGVKDWHTVQTIYQQGLSMLKERGYK